MGTVASAITLNPRNFIIGQTLDIELVGLRNARFQSPLIGMKEGNYLVLEQPSVTRYGMLRDQIMDHQELIIRTICESTTGECLGFRTHVSATVNHPARLLFTGFPRHVEVHELRREKRLLVSQPAAVSLARGEKAAPGMITDISASGCRFQFDDHAYDEWCERETLHIRFDHPETGKLMELDARVCNRRHSRIGLSIGMAFLRD